MTVIPTYKRAADPKRLPKMKAKYKKKWLAALRSGEYSQAADFLHDGDGGYCCLGVLCDILKDEVKHMDEYLKRYQVPPYEVWELTLKKESLKILEENDMTFDEVDDEDEAQPLSIASLIVRNDGIGVFRGRQQSFKRIANIIEKHM